MLLSRLGVVYSQKFRLMEFEYDQFVGFFGNEKIHCCLFQLHELHFSSCSKNRWKLYTLGQNGFSSWKLMYFNNILASHSIKSSKSILLFPLVKWEWVIIMHASGSSGSNQPLSSALWYTSIRSHGGLWRSMQFVRVCCSIAELKLLTFFVSLLKRIPEEWLACRVFFEEVLCQVIRWGINGVESHSQPVSSSRRHYQMWQWSVSCSCHGCPPKPTSVMERVRHVPQKVLHHHCQQRKSPWKGIAFGHDNQGLHITPKKTFLPSVLAAVQERMFMSRQPLFPLVEGRRWFPEGWPLTIRSQLCSAAGLGLSSWVPVRRLSLVRLVFGQNKVSCFFNRNL